MLLVIILQRLVIISRKMSVFHRCEWNDLRKVEVTEDHWQYIINAYVQENQLVGYLGVVVAEWMGELKLHTFAFNEEGQLVDDNEPLLIIKDCTVSASEQ